MKMSNSQMLAKIYAQHLSPETQLHLDAADGGAAFARQFEYIEAEIERTKFAPLKSEEFIPYSYKATKGSMSVTHRTVTELGQAEIVNHYADNLPNADIKTVETEVKCEDLGVEYHYSVQDLDRAALDPSFRLDVERKLSALNAMRRKHDEIAAIGLSDYTRTGLINSSAVPLVTPITGTWTSATASNLIIADMAKLWSSISAATEDTEAPDTLLLDLDSYALLSSKPYGADSNFTVLQWLRTNLDGLKTLDRWGRLNTAGAGSTNRAIAYKKSSDVLKYHAVDLFTEEPPQRKNLKIVTPCRGATGFTDIRKPKAIAFMDGI